MSEKRFIVLPNNVVWDNQLGVVVCRCILEGIGDAENVCQQLNERQEFIEELLKKEKHLHKVITRKDERRNNLVRNKEQLKKENVQLRQTNEQLKHFKDLCRKYCECDKIKGLKDD